MGATTSPLSLPLLSFPVLSREPPNQQVRAMPKYIEAYDSGCDPKRGAKEILPGPDGLKSAAIGHGLQTFGAKR